MKIEIILLGVIGLVFLVDFIMNSRKKPSIDNVVDQIDGGEPVKKNNPLNYLLKRKRNIITFVLLALILKPFLHYIIDREQQAYYDYQQFQEIPYLPIINDINKLLNHYNSISSLVIDKKREYYELDLSLFDSTTLTDLKKINNRLLSRFDSLVPTTYFAIYYRSGNPVLAERIVFNYLMIDKGFNTYGKRQSNYIYRDLYISDLQTSYSSEKEYNRNYPTIHLKTELYYSNYSRSGKVRMIKTAPINILAYIQPKKGDSSKPVFFNMKKVSDSNPDLIPTKTEMIECCNIYYNINDRSFYDKRNFKIGYDLSNKSNDIYFSKFKVYPTQFKSYSFAYHFQNFTKLKLWIFAISFGLLGFLVLLFNDKIKAR